MSGNELKTIESAFKKFSQYNQGKFASAYRDAENVKYMASLIERRDSLSDRSELRKLLVELGNLNMGVIGIGSDQKLSPLKKFLKRNEPNLLKKIPEELRQSLSKNGDSKFTIPPSRFGLFKQKANIGKSFQIYCFELFVDLLEVYCHSIPDEYDKDYLLDTRWLQDQLSQSPRQGEQYSAAFGEFVRNVDFCGLKYLGEDKPGTHMSEISKEDVFNRLSNQLMKTNPNVSKEKINILADYCMNNSIYNNVSILTNSLILETITTSASENCIPSHVIPSRNSDKPPISYAWDGDELVCRVKVDCHALSTEDGRVTMYSEELNTFVESDDAMSELIEQCNDEFTQGKGKPLVSIELECRLPIENGKVNLEYSKCRVELKNTNFHHEPLARMSQEIGHGQG